MKNKRSDKLSLWLVNNETNQMAIELKSFRIATEGIYGDDTPSNNEIQFEKDEDYPTNYNQIEITEDRQTMRYILRYIDNYATDRAQIEKTIRIAYYPMGMNSLSMTFLETGDNEE